MKEYNEEINLLKEALAQQKSDAEIQMPDVEEELKRFHALHDAPRAKVVPFQLRKVAAVVAILLLSGAAFAALAIQQGWVGEKKASAEVAVEQVQEVRPAKKVKAMDNEVTEDNDSWTFENAPLEKILNTLSEYYELEKPVFEPESVKELRFYVTLEKKWTVAETLAFLNNFGKVSFTLQDQHILVKQKEE